MSIARVIGPTPPGFGVSHPATSSTPGPIDTALFRKGKSEAQLAASAAFSPMNRVGKPEEVANVVAFLAGPEASWITGQVMRTNGGWI